MIKRNNWWKTVAFILIIIAVGVGAFFIGRTRGALKAAAERQLDVYLNRGELEGLGEIEGPVYVTGHRSPDSDSVCSAIAYAWLLQKLGYDAQAVVLGEINNETELILQEAEVEVPPLLEDASGKNVILVDHGEYTQSADGLEDANISALSIITAPERSRPAIRSFMTQGRSVQRRRSSGCVTGITV